MEGLERSIFPDGHVAQRQDWGQIIGAGIVAVGILTIAVNLAMFEIPARLLEKLAVPSLWLQIGRWSCLAVILNGGGLLLWRILRRRQVPEGAFQRATGYIQRIEKLLKGDPDEHKQQLLAQIHTWQRTIETLTRALADLDRSDHVIQSDLCRLPVAIADLERQLTEETNPLLRTDLEQMLLQHKNQQRSLEQLQTTRRRAEIQVERAAVVLGTIYSQLLTYCSSFHMTDYQHLADDVAQEVQRLQTCLEALLNWGTEETGNSGKI